MHLPRLAALILFVLHVVLLARAGAQPTQTRMGFEVDGQQGRLVVVRVLAGSGAAKAGLRVGDVIVGYHGQAPGVQTAWSWDLAAVRANERRDGRLTLVVARAGASDLHTIAITGGAVRLAAGKTALPWEVGPPGRHFIGYGLGIDDGELASCHGKNDCVVVKRVFDRSSARSGGVKPGDRVLEYAGLRPAEQIARYGAGGLQRALTELRGNARLGGKLKVRMFRPGTGDYEVELGAGWVIDPKTAPPPACVADAEAISRAIKQACAGGDDACRAGVADAKSQLSSLEACVRTAPAQHRKELTAKLERARAVITERDTAVSTTERLALPDSACRGVLTLGSLGGRLNDTLFTVVKDQNRQGLTLACLRPGRSGATESFGAQSAMGYLARADHGGRDPLQVALAFNVYVRLVVPAADQPIAAEVAAVLAGYPRIVPVSAMKAALSRAFDAEIASRLAAGVDAGVARAAGSEAELWKQWERYGEAMAPVRPVVDELRASLQTGAPAAMLERLDAARAELLAGAKSRSQALMSPAFRELSGLARAIAAAHQVPRPFEQALPEAFHPTIEAIAPYNWGVTHDLPRDVADRYRTYAHYLVKGVQMGRDAAREHEQRAGSGRGASRLELLVLPIKRVRAGAGSTQLALNNRQAVSYAGQCRTVLVFIDAAGQGWGKDKCSADTSTTQVTGPEAVTVPTTQLAGAKPGRLIEIVAKPDGSAAYPVRVWDSKRKQMLAIGPFEL
jgi:hypothetical protein